MFHKLWDTAQTSLRRRQGVSRGRILHPFSCQNAAHRPLLQTRWQSQTTFLTNDEEQSSDSPPSNDDTDIGYYWKRVLVPSTAKLGVDALGKPAEVLILPQRSRPDPEDRRAEWKKDHIAYGRAREDVVKIHESLEAELEPISMEQVKTSIDALMPQSLSKSKYRLRTNWVDLRDELCQSFNRAQMLHYIGYEDAEETQVHHEQGQKKAGPASKRRLAAHIMNKLWQLPTPETDDVIEISRHVPLKPRELELFLADSDRTIQQIVQKYGVRVDVFQSAPKIQLTGSQAVVEPAISDLMALKQKISEGRLILPEGVVPDATGKMPENLLESIRQKYKVLVSQKGDSLSVTTFGQSVVDAIQRDLFLFGVGSHLHPQPSSHVEVLQDTTNPIRASVPVNVPSDTDKLWYRRILAKPRAGNAATSEIKPSPEVEMQMPAALGQFVQKVRNRRESKRGWNICVDDVQIDWTAHFGQAVVADEQQATGKIHIPRKTTFVSDIPFLAEFLAHTAEQHASHTTASAETQRLLHLRFRPSSKAFKDPSLEIWLAGGNRPRTARHPLQMFQVSLKLETESHHVLLPEAALDLKLEKQKSLIVFHAGQKAQKQALPILAQLSAYFGSTHGIDQTRLDPILRLDLAALKKSSTRVRAVDTTNSEREPDKQKNDVDEGQKHLVTYVLESAEIVDRASCVLPGGQHVLEHDVSESHPSSWSYKYDSALKMIASSSFFGRSIQHEVGQSSGADIARTSTGDVHSQHDLQHFVEQAYQTALSISSFLRTFKR